MRWWFVAIGLAACGGARRPPPDDFDEDLPRGAERSRELYTLWWNGARIGDVDEEITRDARGVTLRREENVRVMRGDALAASRLVLMVRSGADLDGEEITIDQLSDGGSWSGTATRAEDRHWIVKVDGEDELAVTADAVPAELVPLRVARDGRFGGKVLLAGSAFATALLTVEQDGDYWNGRLEVPGGALYTQFVLERDGTVVRAAGADGIVAVRASAADVREPYDPPEVVDGTAVPVKGAIDPDAKELSLAIAPMPDRLPPAIPGQRIAIDGDRWGVVLDPSEPGDLPAGDQGRDRTDDIAEIVRTIDLQLEEDLAVTATTMASARKATSGDCTTHALLFAALAGDAGIDYQLVTGFRLDGDHLVRHRWAVAWTGSRWMAVDPTHGEAPARGFLLGLAVHGADASEIALADTVTFADTGGAHAKVQK